MTDQTREHVNARPAPCRPERATRSPPAIWSNVTPGDLLRTASLTQIHRQTTAAGPARGMARLPSL
ncbi:hypothetical protein J7E99_08545 [Streptomyces sp. ISL-44]|uniref:hypothetical protein n=1 Tax=Streptomyces sp. ISL-44 TaxID=2819184 RepID=UPI001BE7B388|nr:hypothetical protein [Streptomyces sp. ISL-44]MBT2540746.1 hypothetical protein [Streptomyces sp. ISL-44]